MKRNKHGLTVQQVNYLRMSVTGAGQSTIALRARSHLTAASYMEGMADAYRHVLDLLADMEQENCDADAAR